MRKQAFLRLKSDIVMQNLFIQFSIRQTDFYNTDSLLFN